jgi:hypothetical protein
MAKIRPTTIKITKAAQRKSWIKILDSIEQTIVPIDIVITAILTMKDGDEYTYDVRTMFQDGATSDEICEILTDDLHKYDYKLNRVDYVLDINKLKDLVQPMTNRLLMDC